jgi:dihydrofolate reductase
MNIMRRIILDLAITLDGYIEGTNGEIDWLQQGIGEDFGDILSEILFNVDLIFYGRVSYDLWGNYEPPANSSEQLKRAYQNLHSKKKYVFSKTKKSDDATFIDSDIYNKVSAIKQEKGGDIWLYGGSKLVTTFINLGLIDVFRLAVYPVLLGKGKSLFNNLKNEIKLQLDEMETSDSGVVVLKYILAK